MENIEEIIGRMDRASSTPAATAGYGVLIPELSPLMFADGEHGRISVPMNPCVGEKRPAVDRRLVFETKLLPSAIFRFTVFMESFKFQGRISPSGENEKCNTNKNATTVVAPHNDEHSRSDNISHVCRE